MAGTRPTAVNLFWAIDRMKETFAAAVQAGASVTEIRDRLEADARAIHDEDVASCRAIGGVGAAFVPDGARILTHCNAGALATAGYGTALGVIRAAAEAGKRVSVVADETRPFLQGARLTAWELVRDGIDTTVITDNMAGALMRQGLIDLVVVGADRIAANGDVANKIGTYSVAVLARAHGIPFYVAAPLSTIDLATPDGAGIPIEERPYREVTHVGPNRLTPEGRADPQPGVRRHAERVRDGHLHRARRVHRAVRGVASKGSLAGLTPCGTHEEAGAVRCAFWELRRRATRRPRPSSRRSTTPHGRGSCDRASWRRRSRSIASGAASCPNWRRASTSATSAASSSARWGMRRSRRRTSGRSR